jgi:hypothetical protein
VSRCSCRPALRADAPRVIARADAEPALKGTTHRARTFTAADRFSGVSGTTPRVIARAAAGVAVSGTARRERAFTAARSVRRAIGAARCLPMVAAIGAVLPSPSRGFLVRDQAQTDHRQEGSEADEQPASGLRIHKAFRE